MFKITKYPSYFSKLKEHDLDCVFQTFSGSAPMESPVHIFREEEVDPKRTSMGTTCSPGCIPVCTSICYPNSSLLVGWGDYENVTDYTVSPTQDSNHTTISPTISVIITAVYSMVFVIGLVGNALVMFVIIRYTKMKTATNIYIFNLALADALVTTTMPFQSTEFLMNSWPFGDILCKIVISIDYYNMFTSIFTLTMMSVDRYIAVCHPVKALDFRTPLKAKFINVCIWMLSSSVGISAIALGGTKMSDDRKRLPYTFNNSRLDDHVLLLTFVNPPYNM
ncbi:kappa-type opioid receptor isoform X2 [Bufo gargarizans]|uniref:kappa-type opioid receptor isoform X2 n=1 Tax=Bufo gargarizans TaxID=30331 RepID=UPI001CF2FB54|nr:kappa-type opioid receptor isoform X2 [Bufo gargarizans]